MTYSAQGATFDQLERLRTLQLYVVTRRLDSEADEEDPEEFATFVHTDTAEVNMCASILPSPYT